MRKWVICCSLLLLSVSCERAVAPGERPRLSREGREAAEQLIFLLKTLRTVDDAQTAVHRFRFVPPFLDTLRVDSGVFDPADIGTVLSGSVAKTRAVESTPIAKMQAGIAGSIGPTPRHTQIWWESAVVDSLISLTQGSNEFTVRMEYAPEAVWDSCMLVFAGRWVHADTTSVPRIDSVERIRSRDSSGTRRVDKEMWSVSATGTVSLLSKDQSVSNASGLIYRHRADLNGDIVMDSVMWGAASQPGFMVMKRQDTSPGWWNGVGASLILEYRDSLTVAAVSRTRMLIEGSYNFRTPGSAQSVTVSTNTNYRSGPVRNSITTSKELWQADAVEPVSLQKTDYYTSLDTVFYTIPSFTPDGQGQTRCTLTVRIRPLPANRPQSAFGTVDSSLMRYALIGRPGAGGDFEYVEMYRADYYGLSNPVMRAEWEYTPGQPAPLGSFTRRPAGKTTVTARHRGNQSTEFRRWQLVRGTGPDSLWVTWAGDATGAAAGLNRTIDTLAVIIIGSDSIRTYQSRSMQRLRTGRLRLENGAWSIDDTLHHPTVRVISGTLDSLGLGTLTVSGQNAYEVIIGADSLEIRCAAPHSCPVSSVTWVRAGNEFTGRPVDAGGNAPYRYRLVLDPGGFITGRFTAVDTSRAAILPSAENISVSPLYQGSARMHGIFEFGDLNIENPGDVREMIRIMLWGETVLAGEVLAQ